MKDAGAMKCGPRGFQTLNEALEELERTDPEVAEAKRDYDLMVDRILTRKELRDGTS